MLQHTKDIMPIHVKKGGKDRPLKGMSVDGRYEVIQNGIDGFLNKRGRVKNREYNTGIGVQDQGVALRIQDMFSTKNTITNDLNMTQSNVIRDMMWSNNNGFINTRDLFGFGERIGKNEKQNSNIERSNQKKETQDGSVERSNQTNGASIAGRDRYTTNTENDSCIVRDWQLLQEFDEGLTTFRVDLKKKEGDNDMLELFDGDSILVESESGTITMLEIEAVTYGQEALINERTRGVQPTRCKIGEQHNRHTHWKRSKAHLTAYITARVCERNSRLPRG